ncbi:hypothetical protein F5Y16DRAFT_359243 [Xylariaceae sp. FL0255]|nr:hypothetical protein F5Y16DRAFT_359243 [Xylariaceae sp. FL0255]
MAPPPPPATPTPHRFLVPKLSQPRVAAETQTPRPMNAFQQPTVGSGAGAGSGQQFQATPRFSLHTSTPRTGGPSSSVRLSTPGASVFRARGVASIVDEREIHDVVDVESSSQAFDENDADEYEGLDDDEVVVESSPLRGIEDGDLYEEEYAGSGDDGDRTIGFRASNVEEQYDEDEKRSRKRRRISLSPFPTSPTPPVPSRFGLRDEDGYVGQDSSPRLRFDNTEDDDEDRGFDDDPEDTEMNDRDAALDIDSSFPGARQISPGGIGTMGHERYKLPGSPSLENAHEHEHQHTPLSYQYQQAKQPLTSLSTSKPPPNQPKFQRAPKFKPPEPPPEGHPRPEPLPDAFSPSAARGRRGAARYVPGGLAAELRDWLVDVEAGVGVGSISSYGSSGLVGTVGVLGGGREREREDQEKWVARVRIDEVRGGTGFARGMTLVSGRVVVKANGADAGTNDANGDEGSDKDRAEEYLSSNTVKIILAGQGRLTGLGVGNIVRPGVILGIARPTWEVVLDGLGRWGVACDWVVLR